MSDKSKINWCDSTLRLWNGCSPSKERPTGCAHCYATRDAVRMAGNPNPKVRAAYEGLTTPNGHWNGTLRLASDEMWTQARRWKRGRVIFVNSGSDVFHEAAPDEWIDRLFLMAHECPQHTFLILTKRVERMASYIDALASGDRKTNDRVLVDKHGFQWQAFHGFHMKLRRGMAPENVYLGMSASTQPELDSGAPALISLAPAGWNTFISLEPLCGAITIPPALLATLSGVIVGGESGPHARPMHPDWVRSIRDQCAAAGVCFQFKQWGEWVALDCVPVDSLACSIDLSGTAAAHDPRLRYIDHEGNLHPVSAAPCGAYLLALVGKHAAGRTLDGQTHDALPWGEKLKGQATP